MRRVTVAVAVAGMMAAAALGSGIAAAQEAPETFRATASVALGRATETAPVTVHITRYASVAERDAVIAAVRDGGTVGAHKAVAAMSAAGFIEVGGRRTPINFASQRPADSGRMVTVVTPEPILFLGAGLPPAKPEAGFELAIAILYLNDSGATGELSPAAKIGVDGSGALVIQESGTATVTLTRVARAK